MNNLFKKLIFIAPLFVLLLASCKNKNPETEVLTSEVCTIENPLETIEWLKQTKESLEIRMIPSGAQIIQYEYNGECVFWIDACYHCYDGLVVVYNANQDVICEFGSIAGLDTCPDFSTEATNEMMLWDGVQ